MVTTIIEQEKNEKLREDYIIALNKTLDELKEKSNHIFDDMFDNFIADIEIKINILPGNIVGYTINKNYHTKVSD